MKFCKLIVALVGLSAFSFHALAQDAASRRIVVISIGGATLDNFKETAKAFERDKNVKIDWISGGSTTEILAKIVATKDRPEYDLAITDEATVYAGGTRNVWTEPDPAVMPNLKDVSPKAVMQYGVGYGFFFAGMFLKTDEFEKKGWAPPRKWADLFRPEFCKRVGLFHPNIIQGVHLLGMLGGGDVNQASSYEKGIDVLSSHRDCIPILETASARAEEKIQSGDYLIGHMTTNRILPLIKKGAPLKFLVPEDNTIITFGGMSAVKNVADPARTRLAMELMNFMLSPEAQQKIVESSFFLPVNLKVQIPDDFKKAGIPDAQAVDKMLKVSPELIEQNRREWIRQLDRRMAR